MECSIIIIYCFEVLVNELILFYYLYVLFCFLGVDIVSFVGNNMGVGGVCLVGSYCLEVIIIF